MTARDADTLTTTPGATAARWIGAALLLVYAAPLFFPPAPVAPGTLPSADAWFIERVFPGVPAWWVVMRLVALAGSALLLSGASIFSEPQPTWLSSSAPAPLASTVRRRLALAVAVLQALGSPWALHLGPGGQCAYLLGLFVPAALLARTTSLAPAGQPRLSWRSAAPAAAVIAVWIALRLATDLNSPRAAHVVDGWLGVLAIARFVTQGKNILTDVLDPDLMGVSSVMLFFQGVPLFQAGVLTMSFRAVQIFQILSIGASAAALSLVTRGLVGAGLSAVAVAVFLFAPYTRFVTLFPGPFLVGPLYSTAVALAALAAVRWRSEAALALLGTLAAIAIGFPGVVPTAGFFVAVVLWQLRRDWRRLWVGLAAGLASFAAVILPALPNVFTPDVVAHFRYDGLIELIDPTLLGQLPIASFSAKREWIPARPADIVAAAVIAPFAHPRMGVRLWGDAIFDPLGGALIAIGLAACLRAALRSWNARVLLLFFGAALSPALVSPVNVANLVHAVVLPVPAALVAAAGFAAMRQQFAWSGRAVLIATAAICLGGTVLFDVVNPRILRPASFGIMFDVLPAADARRVVVLDYPKKFNDDVKRWLYTGAVTAFGGEHPVGYLAYEPGALPVEDLTSAGKDLLFWSLGMEQDLALSEAVCAARPSATLYEIWDAARLGRVYGARLGQLAWQPNASARRWRSWDCQSRGAAGA